MISPGLQIPHPTWKLPAALALLILSPSGLSAQPIYATPSETGKQQPIVMDKVVVDAVKTHTLFMGADISVNLDKDLYPVRDVVGTSWVVDINGKDQVISAKKAPLNLKITPNLKLAEVSAKISGFRREAAYSFQNDPSVQMTRGLSQSAAANADLQAISANAQHTADASTNKALGSMASLAASDTQFGASALLASAASNTGTPYVIPKGGFTSATVGAFIAAYTATAAAQQASTLATIQSTANQAANQATNADEPVGNMVTNGHDAMDVEFDISSVHPLQHPYIVTITRIKTPGNNPGYVQNHIYARALDPIDARVSHVQFSEEGFPFEYDIVDFQVHIYDRGVEVATNLAKNRVELTRDEAFLYVKMEYLDAHKGETLPAVAVMGKLPAELPNRIARGEYTATYYVQVSKDGLGHEVYSDRGCSHKVSDPFLATVVEGLRFKPALERGKPVEGVAVLDLTKLQF
jgi:hypothetical protein